MGRAIGDALKADGIRQAEFARRVGVSEKHLCKVVAGQAIASPGLLDLWAIALGRRWSIELVGDQAGGEQP